MSINGGHLTSTKKQISEEALNSYSALRIYSAPFIVIAMYGASIGNISISEIDGCVNQACCVLRESGMQFDFAFYTLKAAKDYLIRKADGGGQPNISQDKIKSLWLAVPTIEEQAKIAGFLNKRCSEIDATMEQTRQAIEEYKALKQAVITEAVTKGVRGDRPMKDSGVAWIGEIPVDWGLIRLQFIIDCIESGTSVNAGQQAAQDGELGVLKTSCVSRNTFLPQENKTVNIEEYGRVSCPVKANTIIINRSNSPELVGASGYVAQDYPNLYLSDKLWQVHFMAGINVKYIYYWTISKRIRNYYSSLAVGASSSMQNITQDQFYHAKCPTPPADEQQEIVTYLDAKCAEIDTLISAKQNLLAELEAYKKSVIYEYVTGKKEAPVCP